MKEVLTQVLAWLVLSGFVAVVVVGIREAFHANAVADPPANPLTYVATALATVVATIVYAYFGQPGPTAAAASGLLSAPGRGHDILEAMYALVYFGAGAATLITWFLRTSRTPVLIRTIASGFFGLAIAAVPAYLKP